MKWLRAILPVVLLGLGVFGLVFLVKTKPQPAKKAVEHLGALVEVRALVPGGRDLTVEAHGTVRPARQVVIQPEVTGRITWLSPELVPGGRVQAGDRLLRIDGRDYQLSVKQQQSTVDQAELQLKLEKMQHAVARDEWQIIGEDERATDEGRAIALRRPQLATAEATLAAAKSARERAQLSVGRTSLSAPFNAWVQSENVELGQLVGPQSQLATLVGTEAYWVQVAVGIDQLAHLAIPGLGGQTEGSLVTVTQGSGASQVQKQGRIVRLLGDLDPAGRMARLLVEIRDPLTPQTGQPRGSAALPLLVGAFVHVTIAAGHLDNVFEIERSALHDGERLFLLAADNTLEIRRVETVWRAEDTVLVKSGLSAGDRMIVTRIATPIAGMRLRLAKRSPQAPGAGPPDAGPAAEGG